VEHADAERARAARGGTGPLVALVLLGLLAGRATAGTYYVDGSSPQGSPSGPGTQAQPYSTIAAAVSARGTAGNTILVQPGTSREITTFSASGTSSAPIVLQANGNVTIDGADRPVRGARAARVQRGRLAWPVRPTPLVSRAS
jgi:hypothetical protein